MRTRLRFGYKTCSSALKTVKRTCLRQHPGSRGKARATRIYDFEMNCHSTCGNEPELMLMLRPFTFDPDLSLFTIQCGDERALDAPLRLKSDLERMKLKR